MIPEPYNYILAAFSIDFEGSISFRKREKKTGVIRFETQIMIKNVSKELLEELKDSVGFGSVFFSTPYREKGSSTYRWWMSIKEQREILIKIEPYLTLKRDQAIYLLRALEILKTRAEVNKLGYECKQELYTHTEFVELLYIDSRMRELNYRLPQHKRIESRTEAEKLLIEFRKRGT